MEFDLAVFEIKRSIDVIEKYDFEFAQALQDVLNEFSEAKGDCACGA